MLKHEAIVSIGKIVVVFTGVDGNYIGELIDNMFFGNVAVVKILACTRYPSQRTIIYKFNNYERWPYICGSVETFPVECLEIFYSNTLPDYYELMKEIFETTFLIETDGDRRIYERHKKHWKGK